MPDDLPPIWMALGLSPVTETLTILGAAKTEEESKAQHSRATDDLTYRRSFNIMSPRFGQDLFDWLIHHKVPRVEAVNIIREIGKGILAITEDTDDA
jgi:hypothetical protein